LIVTSPLHTRRALSTFRKIVPGVAFGVTGAPFPSTEGVRGIRETERFALREMLKTLRYWAIYGVNPLNVAVSPPGMPVSGMAPDLGKK
jgi:uncharacterized SAM-binding protein YcdF (DUF218 family)